MGDPKKQKQNRKEAIVDARMMGRLPGEAFLGHGLIRPCARRCNAMRIPE
jgi:hypothetical protein